MGKNNISINKDNIDNRNDNVTFFTLFFYIKINQSKILITIGVQRLVMMLVR